MSRNSEGASENASKLIELARKKFGKLNEAEETLFRCFADGGIANCSDKSDKNNDPNGAKDWDENTRVIRAECIFWLCTDRKALELATHNGVEVKGARIKGKLHLSGARIPFPLYFEKSAFPGGINLQYAEIRSLYLDGTYTKQIYGDGLKVEDYVFLRRGFKSEDLVNLVGVTIGSNFDCMGGKFVNKGKVALYAGGGNIKGNVYLNKGFKAEGEVHLTGATIGGNLECDGGRFINKGATALYANSAKIEGSVFLNDGFKSEGEVNLAGARIGGVIDCEKGQFINRGAIALTANGANIKGSVFLRNGFKAEGQVVLVGATISRNLECDKSQFINEKGTYALRADSMKVKGHVYMRDGFKAEGEVDLTTTTIDGYFQWRGVNSPERVKLRLSSVTVAGMWDDKESWPEEGKLFLHGLVYNEIDERAPRDADSRIDWLRRQYDDKAEKDKDQFRPQPYEQLAAVLRKGGQDEDARKILIAKNKDKARLTKLTFTEKCWYRVLGPMIGYGYRPWRAFGIGLVIVLLGWLFFWAGYSEGVMTPVKGDAYVSQGSSEKSHISPDYPKFCAPVYSLDVFVPLVDLHQSSYWLPNANRDGELHLGKFSIPISGKVIRCYLWCEIIAGWILTSLLVVGLTGLVRT